VNLSQRDLAALASCSQALISLHERGPSAEYDRVVTTLRRALKDRITESLQDGAVDVEAAAALAAITHPQGCYRTEAPNGR
jgi:hypothetical protein